MDDKYIQTKNLKKKMLNKDGDQDTPIKLTCISGKTNFKVKYGTGDFQETQNNYDHQCSSS